jgi:hypothetical protein
MLMCHSGTLVTFSKFCLNTQKSTNIKVVQNLQGGISNFEWKRGKFANQTQDHYSPEAQKSSNWHSIFSLDLNPFQIRFQPIFRGSPHIQLSYLHVLKFTCNFLRIVQANRGTCHRPRSGTRRRDVTRVHASPPRHTTAPPRSQRVSAAYAGSCAHSEKPPRPEQRLATRRVRTPVTPSLCLPRTHAEGRHCTAH